MTLPRNLAFRDKFVWKLKQEISGGCDGDPILFPDNTTPVKFLVEFSQDEFTKVLSALMTGADLSYPDEAHEVTWLLLRQVDCPLDLCEILTECLQPLFDELSTQIDAVQNTADAIRQTQLDNGVQPPEPVPASSTSAICGGAAAVVDAMNLTNEQFYLEAEESAGDNILEYVPILIELIPAIGQLPIDELYELANSYFSNQYLDYQADFIAARDDMIGSLRCYIEANDGVFDYVVWGDWLNDLESNIPDNRAASVFARFSPLRQTFLNQIAAIFNGNESLPEYFEVLYTQYYAGTQNPITCPDYECPPFAAVPIFTEDWPGLEHIYGGTELVDEGDGYWSALTTQAESLAWTMALQDVAGRNFIIDEITLDPVNCAECFIYRQVTDVIDCVNFCDNFHEPVDRYGWTWNAADGQIKVTFRFMLSD